MQAPTTFVASSSALQQKLTNAVTAGFTYVRLVLVDSPIWHSGEIVGTFTGTVPAAQYKDANHYLVLQDNGYITAVTKGITGTHTE